MSVSFMTTNNDGEPSDDLARRYTGRIQDGAPQDNGSLFVYRSITRSDTWAPAWVWKWLATDSMEAVMASIRARAEAPTGR